MSSYFDNSNIKGELKELQYDLNSTNFEIKKEAVKRIIAYMTIGKDLSSLFQSVIKCLENPEIELKKLVYLYIINYSRHKPDDAIMVINLFRKDIHSGSPLIKALAVRTMGCLRVHKLNEYLAEPLKQALVDRDPYVRKTAVLCVPKVFEVSPHILEGVIPIMQEMLSQESNAIVLANLVVSLQELSEMKKETLILVNKNVLQRLLIVANECVEWGQVFVLDILANYVPSGTQETEEIIERIIPRLSHINPSVVLSAIKIILKYIDYLNNQKLRDLLIKKIGKPLASLVQWSQPEIQYTILRNVNIMLQKWPQLLCQDLKVFFVKFNEPHYIKLEKLEILINMCDKSNYEEILNEFKEYANEIDAEFVTKVIKAIGKISIMYEMSVNKCLRILLILMKSAIEAQKKAAGESTDFIINEIIIQLSKIYRKYPEKTKIDGSLLEISKQFNYVSDPQALASIFWMIGEFYLILPDCSKMVQEYIEDILEQPRLVQMQILTATVKIFLYNPDGFESQITNLLELLTQKCPSADIRDKAYIYWRMLSLDPDLTKLVVFNERPQMEEQLDIYQQDLLNILMDNFCKISTVFHKKPEIIFKDAYTLKIEQSSQIPEQNEPIIIKTNILQSQGSDEKVVQNQASNKEYDLLDILEDEGKDSPKISQSEQKKQGGDQQNNFNLLDEGDLDFAQNYKKDQNQEFNKNQTMNQEVQKKNDNLDIFNDLNNQNFNLPPISQPQLQIIQNENQKGQMGYQGLKIEAGFTKEEHNNIYLNIKLHNFTQVIISNIEIQMKSNYFGLQILKYQIQSVQPFNQIIEKLHLSLTNNKDLTQIPQESLIFTFGLKTSLDSFYFNMTCDLNNLIEQFDFPQEQITFISSQLPQQQPLYCEIQQLKYQIQSLENLQQALKDLNFCLVSSQINPQNQTLLNFIIKMKSDIYFVLQIMHPNVVYSQGCSLICKSTDPKIVPLFIRFLNEKLKLN